MMARILFFSKPDFCTPPLFRGKLFALAFGISCLVSIPLWAQESYSSSPEVKTATSTPADVPQQVSEAGHERPFRIFMVQWRGNTVTDQGFIDYFANRHIPIETVIRNPAQNPAEFEEIRAEIRKTRPDLVYTWSMASAQNISGKMDDLASADFISDIPTVNCMVSDPVVGGLTKDWKTSGRNMTGVSHIPQTSAQLQTIQSYMNVKKIAAIYDSTQSSPRSAVRSLEANAAKLGLEVEKFPIPVDENGASRIDAIAETVDTLAKSAPDIVYIGPDTFLLRNQKTLFDAIAKYELPTFAAADPFLSQGQALFGLVGNYYIAGQYCAEKAIRILSDHTQPRDIPFDALPQFTLKINMDVARELDRYPPLGLLSFAELLHAPGN
ncbi:ABC transporter substrate-binding protein [Thalassospira lucentensis]|uniref:ABC transporter substrate-binding protein n=1 Tax=Thalassospira lucentensis TaxID=168935 RepID=UPI00142D7966|nr:ABC transporter substrate-binding protein [Thalassospira lucentensis]NIZ03759.1 hypothetical protein [Thalassospira lucentensis]